jgi:hypothetical protein
VKYTILQPGKLDPAVVDPLYGVEWTEHDFAAEARSVDHGPDAPDFVPTYSSIKRLLDGLMPRITTEHVAVQSPVGPTDMFVDEEGGPTLKGLPLNDAATVIYWTASWMGALMRQAGITTINRKGYERLYSDARDRARAALLIDFDTPRIHGPAVLFDGRMWF